ncbi:MAG: hypothetical protein Q9178_002390 [Gyalolechia marmorata]
MDPLSAIAGVLTLLDAACKSSQFICIFFRAIVDGPSIVQSHCRFLQVFQANLAQLREVCTITEFQSEHVLRLDTNLNQCLEDLKTAERRIMNADRNMKSGNLRRTWALVRSALLRGDLWIDNFFRKSAAPIAAIKNQTSVVQFLLEQGADSDATTNTGDTPLHLAVRSKVDFNLARTLLNHGADISCLNNRKRTPLHAFFSPIISQLALHSPESMNAITTDASGMTLAHYFSWTHQSSPTDFQFPNISTHLKARDAAGRTPLHFASQRGNIPVMQYLLSQYQYPARMQPDNQGNTVVHEAVQSSRAPAALALLSMHGFSLKQRNNGGHTPAQYAVLWGTVAATEMLLDRDPGVGEGKRGLVALARRTENLDVEAWLLGRGSGEEDEDEDVNWGRDELGDMGQIDFAGVGGWRVIGETIMMFLVTITIVYTGACCLVCSFFSLTYSSAVI